MRAAFNRMNFFNIIAQTQGFEPRLDDLQSPVLPLHQVWINGPGENRTPNPFGGAFLAHYVYQFHHKPILTKKATPKSRLERFVNCSCLQLQGSNTKCFPKRERRTIFEHIPHPNTKLTNEECLTMFDIFEKFIFVNPQLSGCYPKCFFLLNSQ